MNTAIAFSVKKPDGYIGVYRVIWGTKLFTVTDGKKDQLFKTATEAELAAWRAKNAKEYPVLSRDVQALTAVKSEANEVFSKGVFAKGNK